MRSMQDRFTQTYEEYGTKLTRYAYRLTRNDQDAADITHETFIRLFQREEYPVYVQGWLYKTAYCLFVDQWRLQKRKKTVSMENMEEMCVEADLDSPEQSWLQYEVEHELMNMLSQLQDRDRQALLLRAFNEATYLEIATALDCSEKVVKSILYRARQKMKKLRQAASF